MMLRSRSLAAVWMVFALLGSISMFTSPMAASRTSKINWLISPTEAARLTEEQPQAEHREVRPEDNNISVETALEQGPTLQVDEPQANLVHSPINMRIRFIRKAAPVDMGSLEVHAQKWVLGSFRGNLDLSPRVRKFVIADGIDMRGQDIPKGRYRFDLAIKDTNGARTEGMLLLDVQ